MENKVQVDGYTFHYEVLNKNSERQIIFINGWCSVRYFWKYIIEEFYEYGTCIPFDLLGHNQNPIPLGFFSNEMDLEKILNLQAKAIKKLYNGNKLTLVGHSAGGLTVLGVASLIPDIVDKVVSICPPAYGPIKGLLYPAKVVNDLKLDFVNFTTLELVKFIPNLILTWFSKGSGDEKEFSKKIPTLKKFLFEYQKHFRTLEVKTVNQFLRILDRSNLLPFLENYQVPTLVISGEMDPLVAPSQFREISTLSNSIRLVPFYKSGHIPMMEEREKFLEVVGQFLRE